jgi:Na+/H+-dicarboxylate symporter
MAEPLIKVIEIANDTIMQMITLVIWLTPLGVGSLVAGFVLKVCDITSVLKALAKYVATVLAGKNVQLISCARMGADCILEPSCPNTSDKLTFVCKRLSKFR